MAPLQRMNELRRRRKRRAKLLKLRARLAKAKNQDEIQKLIQKLKRVSPFYPVQRIAQGRSVD
ncbi:MAG: hypothetical protein HY537_06085 [Deltaproteobacteria bacterium]|nr:hypothetical protein [Deltaproteobacteria bacterium]